MVECASSFRAQLERAIHGGSFFEITIINSIIKLRSGKETK
jgi:hypothetical protein